MLRPTSVHQLLFFVYFAAITSDDKESGLDTILQPSSVRNASFMWRRERMPRPPQQSSFKQSFNLEDPAFRQSQVTLVLSIPSKNLCFKIGMSDNLHVVDSFETEIKQGCGCPDSKIRRKKLVQVLAVVFKVTIPSLVKETGSN